MPHSGGVEEIPQRPDVDGYLVHRLLGRGASAHVWSATAPDGDDVALKVVPALADHPAAFAEAALLCRTTHPRVLRLRAVEQVAAGVVLVLDRAPGGSLGALVRARGALDVAEVVGLLAALAGALADLHAEGLVHGDVAPGNVLFAADAAPLLADWGLATLMRRWDGPSSAGGPGSAGLLEVGPPTPAGTGGLLGTPGFADPARPAGTTAPPTAAGDVHGLGAVAWFALAGRVPPPAPERVPLPLLVPEVPRELAALLDAATALDPQHRPSAAELAAACAGLGEARPVHLVPSDEGAGPAELLTHRLRAAAAAAQEEAAGRRARARRRPTWRGAGRALAGAAAAAAVFLGAWVASSWIVDPPVTAADRGAPAVRTAVTDPAADAAADPAPTGASGPEAAVAELADRRARAYVEGDASLLAAVDAPGSVAEQVDAAAIAALREEGVTVRGLRYDVRWVEALPAGAGSAATPVRAVVATSAHERVLADGTVVAVPAAGPVTSLLLLEQHDGRWLVAGTA